MNLLWPYLRRFGAQWRLMLAGMIAGAGCLLAGTGLLALSGWFLSAAAVAGFSVFTARAFNYFPPAGGVRFFSIVRTLCRYGERVWIHEATFCFLRDLRVCLWRAILPLSGGRLAPIRHADLLNRLLVDIDTLDHLYARLLAPLAALIFFLPLLCLFVAFFDGFLALCLSGSLLTAAVLLPWCFYRLGQAPGEALQESRRELRVRLLDYLQGQAEWLLFGANHRVRAEVDAAEARFLDDQNALASLSGLNAALWLLIGGGIVLSVLYLAASGVGQAKPPGPLWALMVLTAMASLECLPPLATAFLHLPAAIQAARRIDALTRPDVNCFPFFPAASPNPASGALQLVGVDFSYRPEVPVLHQLNLEIAAGRKVALLGATGSGKSTLLALITREWTPSAGEIRLDGRALTDYSEQALRGGMSVMSQRVHLFAASLRDNLRLAASSASEPDDAQLASVLERVGLEKLLSGEGLDTWIGDGGRLLSGGEQRRIGIARILLRPAPLWLLDEPTEGLDPVTERAILDLLLEAAQDKTLLMISHRRVGLSAMDEVYRLEAGRLERMEKMALPVRGAGAGEACIQGVT